MTRICTPLMGLHALRLDLLWNISLACHLKALILLHVLGIMACSANSCNLSSNYQLWNTLKKLPYPYSRAPGSESKAPGAPDYFQEANGLPPEKADGCGAL